MPTSTTPTVSAMLLRGLTKHCPWCGRGRLFRRWFAMAVRCPRCDLKFEREEGAFLGSLAINFGVTGLVFIAMLVTWVALTLPDVPVDELTVASVLLTVSLPLLIYPFAKTTWSAIDLLMNPMDSEDIRTLMRGMPPPDDASDRPV